MKTFKGHLISSLFEKFKRNIPAILLGGVLLFSLLRPGSAYAEFKNINQMDMLSKGTENGVEYNQLTRPWEKGYPAFKKEIERLYNKSLNEIYDIYNDYRFKAYTLNQAGKITISEVESLLEKMDKLIKEFVAKVGKERDTDALQEHFKKFKKDLDDAFGKMLADKNLSIKDLRVKKSKKDKVTFSTYFNTLITKAERANDIELSKKEERFIYDVAVSKGIIVNGSIQNSDDLKDLIDNYIREYHKDKDEE